jgi:hypothetical protein
MIHSKGKNANPSTTGMIFLSPPVQNGKPVDLIRGSSISSPAIFFFFWVFAAFQPARNDVIGNHLENGRHLYLADLSSERTAVGKRATQRRR